MIRTFLILRELSLARFFTISLQEKAVDLELSTYHLGVVVHGYFLFERGLSQSRSRYDYFHQVELFSKGDVVHLLVERCLSSSRRFPDLHGDNGLRPVC